MRQRGTCHERGFSEDIASPGPKIADPRLVSPGPLMSAGDSFAAETIDPAGITVLSDDYP